MEPPYCVTAILRGFVAGKVQVSRILFAVVKLIVFGQVIGPILGLFLKACRPRDRRDLWEISKLQILSLVLGETWLSRYFMLHTVKFLLEDIWKRNAEQLNSTALSFVSWMVTLWHLNHLLNQPLTWRDWTTLLTKSNLKNIYNSYYF